MGDLLQGYRGEARAVLERAGVAVWDNVDLRTDEGTFSGLLLPRSETADESHVVLKLANGYNLGIRASRVRELVSHGPREVRARPPRREVAVDASRPSVTLLGTGGTIASRLDYRTGGVVPAFSPEDLYASVPELAETCNLKTRALYSVLSENMGPEQWIGLAVAVAEEIRGGAEGIVIGHGTDTMQHTASVLSFMLQNPPVPIVMVGSQRSSDRPSSDAALNLIHATRAAALSDIAEVTVCMFGPTSDEYGLLHRGTRVRKMHTSYRSTFRTIADIPLAAVFSDRVLPLRTDYCPRRLDRTVTLDAVWSDRATIVYYYPAMREDIIDALVDHGYQGIVIAGTGLGHTGRSLLPALKRAVDRGVHVFMTAQTLWGYVQMHVYDTGRDLMDIGVMPANMLPEVAYMKLGWVLAHTTERSEVSRLMQTCLAHEITQREPHDGYLVLQGGLPDVDRYIKQHRI